MGIKREERVCTRKVVEERDGDGAADDGVHPEPPAGAEDGSGEAGAEDGPQFTYVHGSD